MQNGDFELAGYLIGRDQPVFVTDFQTGSNGERLQDTPNPYGNTRFFGRDQKDPATWSFEFSVAQEDGAAPDSGVLDSLERLATVWNTAVDATDPGAYTSLRYMIGGRVRRVYGRPRNFSFNPSQNIQDGSITATAQFALLDTFSYADAQEQTQLQLRQAPVGAVTLPAVWPVLSVIDTERQGTFDVTGSAEALVDDITFYGPIVNPQLVLAGPGGWTVSLIGTIPYDGWVRLDPRWPRVLNQSGGSAAGMVSRRTYLPDLTLRPGARGLTFTGTDPTSTAKTIIRWRPAYNAL